MPNDNNQTDSTNTNGNNNQPTVQSNMPPIPSSFQPGTPSVQTDIKPPQPTVTPTQSPMDTLAQNASIGKNQSPNMKDFSAVITSEHVPERLGGRKAIATIFGILFLVGSIVAGVFLAQKRQFLPSQAWNCSQYVFEVSQQGEVSVRNGQTRNEPPQKAKVYIDDILVIIFDVPALGAGDAATLGTVDVPGEQGFVWKVDGTVDCQNNGSYEATSTPTPILTESPTPTITSSPTPTTTSISASCSTVKAYDNDWNSLSSFDLSTLKTGNIVHFTVSGTATSGVIDKAKFTINGISFGETTNKKPGTDEFYVEYTIPEGVVSFTVDAQIHHSQLGWF